MHRFQDLNRRPSTIDGYRTAILDYLGPTGLHIAQSTDLNRQVFTEIGLRQLETFPSGTYQLCSMNLQRNLLNQ